MHAPKCNLGRLVCPVPYSWRLNFPMRFTSLKFRNTRFMAECSIMGVLINNSHHKTELTPMKFFPKLVFSHRLPIHDGLFHPTQARKWRKGSRELSSHWRAWNPPRQVTRTWTAVQGLGVFKGFGLLGF